MTKILITGFRHSGTTMLMQLLRNHPQVGWIEMEESYIEFDKPKEWLIMMAKKRVPNLKKYAWGEKIPWGHRPEDTNAKRAINFSKKWLNRFGKQARILHIIRHPVDVASSGRPDGNPGKETLEQTLNTVPKYIKYINNNLYSATIVYEDLVLNPYKHLGNIFHFCGLISNKKVLNRVINSKLKFDRINADRAFAFKKKGIDSHIDYGKILKKIIIRL